MRAALLLLLLATLAAATSVLDEAQQFLDALTNASSALPCEQAGVTCEAGRTLRCGESTQDRRAGRVRLPLEKFWATRGLPRGHEVRVTTGQDGRAIVVPIAPPQTEAYLFGQVRLDLAVGANTQTTQLAHVSASTGPDGLVVVAGYFIPTLAGPNFVRFFNVLAFDKTTTSGQVAFTTPKFDVAKVGGWWGVLDNSGRWVHVNSSAHETPTGQPQPRVSWALGAAVDREGYVYILRGLDRVNRNVSLFECAEFYGNELELTMYAPISYEEVFVLRAEGSPVQNATECQPPVTTLFAYFAGRAMHVEYDRIAISGGFNGRWNFGGQQIEDPGAGEQSNEQNKDSISPLVLLVRIAADHSSMTWEHVLHADQTAPLSYTYSPIEGVFSVDDTSFFAGGQAWSVVPSRTAAEDSVYVIGAVQHSVSEAASEVPQNGTGPGTVVFQPGSLVVPTANAPRSTATAPFVGRFDVELGEWAWVLTPDTEDSTLYLSFFYDVEVDDRGVVHVVGQLPPYSTLSEGFSIGGVRSTQGESWARAHPDRWIGFHLTISRGGRVRDLHYENAFSSLTSISRTAASNVLFWSGLTQSVTFGLITPPNTLTADLYAPPPYGYKIGAVLPNDFLYAPALNQDVNYNLSLASFYQSFGPAFNGGNKHADARFLVISLSALPEACPACLRMAQDMVQVWAPRYAGPRQSATNLRGFVFASAINSDARGFTPTTAEEQLSNVTAYANATGMGRAAAPFTYGGGDWGKFLRRLEGYQGLIPATYAINVRTMQYYGVYTGRQANETDASSAFALFLDALDRENATFFQTLPARVSGYKTLDGQRLTTTPIRNLLSNFILRTQADAFVDDQGYETYLQNTGDASLMVVQTRAVADALKLPTLGFVVDLSEEEQLVDGTVCVAFVGATLLEAGVVAPSEASTSRGIYNWHGSSLRATRAHVLGKRDPSTSFAGITLNDGEFLAVAGGGGQ